MILPPDFFDFADRLSLRTYAKQSIFFFLLLFLSNAALCSQTVIVYRDFGHKGDENQIKGVLHALKDIEVTEFNVGDEEKLQSFVKNQKKRPIVLAVGEKTVVPFAKLLPFEGATTAHLSHMRIKDHAQLVAKVDFIALPVHAIGDFEKTLKGTRTHLIKTIGVSHNRQIAEIEKVYSANKDKLPVSDSYVGVILAGDAPTPEGKILLFTEENARALARYVANAQNKQHLLIINGPRTGKYDPKTLQEIKTAHRDGTPDFITQAFLDELAKNKINPQQFTLFDFQWGPSSSQDMDLVLGAIRATKSSIWVPGESTSSISESIDVLPLGSVFVYPSSSMNSVHKAHVQSELEVGRIRILSTDFREKEQSSKDQSSKNSAAQTIAAALIPPS